MMQAARGGGCACGHVRYRVKGDPIFVNNCHCRRCQQQTGSTSVVNAFYESDRVEVLQGRLTEHMVVSGSGGPHLICRCRECGTALWSIYPRLGRLGLGLRVGTFDEPDTITPDAVIYTDSAMPWVTFPEGIPRFAQTYDFRTLLPAERVGRILALMAQREAGAS